MASIDPMQSPHSSSIQIVFDDLPRATTIEQAIPVVSPLNLPEISPHTDNASSDSIDTASNVRQTNS